MRRLSIVTATFSLALLFTSSSSFAADQYTYRAGQAYLKSAANNHTECEAQCRGDAACRGWNFVRPNPRSRTGICEFNARKTTPVSSPISISGEINTSVDALMSHAVPQTNRMTGNTVRVGTPIVPNRKTPNRRIIKRQMAGVQAPQQHPQQQRIVRRMPIPKQMQRQAHMPVQENVKRAIPAQKANVRTPRAYGFREALVTKPNIQRSQQQPASQQQVSRQQMASRPRVQMTPQEIYRQQMLAVQRRGMEQVQKRAQQQVPQARPQMQARQDIQARRQTQARQQMMQRPPTQQQFAPQARQHMQARPHMMPQQNPYAAPQQPRPQQQMMTQQSSLYGSLHDDLTTGMTLVPRPQTAPDQASNGDAPLATSRAVPTKPVKTEALTEEVVKRIPIPKGYKPLPGLAGG